MLSFHLDYGKGLDCYGVGSFVYFVYYSLQVTPIFVSKVLARTFLWNL